MWEHMHVCLCQLSIRVQNFTVHDSEVSELFSACSQCGQTIVCSVGYVGSTCHLMKVTSLDQMLQIDQEELTFLRETC